MLHVEQQHPGGVGVIAGMDAGELVRQIVLREHDLCDLFEVFRLVFAHPEELRGGEAREGNVGRQRGQLVFADNVIEIVDFFGRAPIVPQNRRTDDVVGFIQRDKAVHLPAGADACNFTCVKAAQQLGNSCMHADVPRSIPIKYMAASFSAAAAGGRLRRNIYELIL